MLRAAAAVVAIAVASASLAGCEQNAGMNSAERAELRALQERLSALESEVAVLRQTALRVDALEQAHAQHITNSSGLFAPTATSPAVQYELTTPGFSTGWTGLGGFTMSVDDLSAYAGSTRVRLRISNTASVTLQNPKLTINYAYVLGDAPMEFKTLEVESLKSYRAGFFTLETITIPDVPPESLKMISVTLNPSRIWAMNEPG